MPTAVSTPSASPPLKAPFPYFGGKSRAAHLVWARFGEVRNYVEPFAGSLACLLHQPADPGRRETVNDLDHFLANFWRALQADPQGLAAAVDWPINETDLHARHRWLVTEGRARLSGLDSDPSRYDLQVAAWWVWGRCCWIGGRWCRATAAAERGRPEMSFTGVHRKSLRGRLPEYLTELAARLRPVTVLCGDWRRAVTPTLTWRQGLTAILLDPPYADTAGRDPNLYAEESLSVAHDVREWAIANGEDPRLRIALCGYAGEHVLPDSWECVPWEANNGYANRGQKRGINRRRERIWFSPHCLTDS